MKQNGQLEQLIGEYRSIILSKNHLAKLKKRIVRNEYDLKLLERIMQKEYEDVRSLEKLSIQSLFQRILGNKDERYEIEKQEYLQSVLKHREYAKTLDLMLYEQGVLEEKVANEEKVFNALNELLVKRDQVISSKYLSLRQILIQVNKEIDQKLAAQREIHEANIVGTKARTCLNDMIALLTKAHDLEAWGDNTSSASIQKQVESYVEQSHENSIKLKVLLLELKDEMEDVYTSTSIRHYSLIDEFVHFHDIYYDRLVSDWIIRHKILSVVNYLKGVQDNLILVLESLKNLLHTQEKNIAELYQRREEVIQARL